MFHSDHIKAGEISNSKFALHNVYELSLVREYPPKPFGTISDARGGWSKYWHFVLMKTFSDRHCAPYKWIFATMHEVLVLNNIVIAFTARNSVLIWTCISVINMCICNVLLNFFVSVYKPYLSGHICNIYLCWDNTLRHRLRHTPFNCIWQWQRKSPREAYQRMSGPRTTFQPFWLLLHCSILHSWWEPYFVLVIISSNITT